MKKNLVLIVLYALLILIFKSANAQVEKNPLNGKILIVVHVQEPFARDELSKEYTADAVKKINQLIEKANPENVIYVKSIHKVLNLTWKKIYVDKIDIALDNRLNIVNQNIFIDEGGDVFKSEELYEFVKGKNINQIVIVGRVAEGCITETILGGKKLGYEMSFISDAVIGETPESKEKALNKLKNKGIKELAIKL
jgi:nicotinamidase-related amidase